MTRQLFAKLKGKRGENKIVFTDKENLRKVDFFAIPEISEDKILQFDSERKIEDDEWFYIELDDEHREMVKPFANCSQNTADMNPVLANDYLSIEAVFKIHTEEEIRRIIFQKITSSSRIESKTFLSFGDHPEITEQKNSIIFSNKVDAYFDGRNKIYFRSFSTIRSLFNGIEDYYNEATDEEVQKITQNPMLKFAESIKIGVRNRKRIAAILADNNIRLDDMDFQNQVREYARRYPEIQLETNDDGKFIIDNDKHLESFLALVSGRYYISEITGEKMEAKATEKLINLIPNTGANE
ncbi:hypothetical protein AGMMS50229_13240 [Campylobacterota bacterium]|nr:hypothetical protein AGMMS50229_13240 [Campylobacterota bacterium]